MISKTIRANRFELVDDNENLLALLASQDNLPFFQLYDENHMPRFCISCNDSKNPVLTLSNESGVEIICIGIYKLFGHQGAAIEIRDELGLPAIRLEMLGKSKRNLTIFDSEGKEIWKTEIKVNQEESDSGNPSTE